MRKQILIAAFLMVLAISFVGLAYCSTQTYSVPARTDYQLILALHQNDQISGSIVVQGGVSNAINFFITDPSGNNVASYSAVTQTSFSFKAASSGNYTVHLDNRDGLLAKSVTFNYTDKPAILGLAFDTFILLAIIVVIVIVVVAVVAVLLTRGRSQTSKPA
jgi:hypothetical protein